VNEKDMPRFAGIEKMIEREVPKMPLPENLGAGPAYNPAAFRRGGGGGHHSRPGQGGGHSGAAGKKKFHPKKKSG
jgi:ATP-dependent RNA helicase RhlE